MPRAVEGLRRRRAHRIGRLGMALALGGLLACPGPPPAAAGTGIEARGLLPLRIIVVPSEQEARGIAAAVGRGVSFERLARERSVGPERERGGYLGRVDPATLSPEAQAALARTRRGRVSPVFPSEGGYAVLQVVPESTARLLDEAVRHEAEAERLLEEGTEAGKQGDFRKAAELLTRAAQMNPDLVDAYYNAAIAYRRLGEMPQAMETMSRAIALKPDDFEARMGLGSWLLEAGRHAEASLHLERAAMVRMDSRDAWLRLAQSYEGAERHRDALGAYRRVLTLLGTEDSRMLAAVLRAAMRSRDGAAAVDAARRLQAQNPGHLGFVLMGRALLVKGDFVSAAQELEKAVALNPVSVPSRLSLSEAYARQGKAPAAAEQMLEVIRLEPKNPEHYRVLSERYEEAGRLDLAIVAMRDGLSAAAGSPRPVLAQLSARLVLLYEVAGMTREASLERQRLETLQAPER